MVKDIIKRLEMALTGLVVLAALTACGTGKAPESSEPIAEHETVTVAVNDNAGGGSSDELSSSTAAIANRQGALPESELVTAEMMELATSFAEPELERLAAVMRRAEKGEPVTIGVIGGSITQGSSASRPENSYAQIMKRWWEKTFPQSAITYINAGIGGTDSYLGVHRMDGHLLQYKPDFVIVEFSVNDSDTNFYKQTYDNLVRRVLKQDNLPAVLLLFMIQENGTTAQVNDSMVGFNYRLPMISYGNVVMDEIKKGAFTWKDISPDNIHPNDKGHAICGELIWRYLSSVYEKLDEITVEPKELTASAATKEIYMTAGLYENAEQLNSAGWGPEAVLESEGFAEGCRTWSVFSEGWSAKEGGRLSFTVKASRVGILYGKCTNGKYGKAKVYVDGVEAMTLDGDFTGGWGDYGTAAQVMSEKESSEHIITIEVDREADKTCFDVYALLVTD